MFLVKDVLYGKSMKSTYDVDMVQLQQIEEKSLKKNWIVQDFP
jgi:hypothetical protein